MTTIVQDRRTRKKLATHRALAGAARELVLERGMDAVTVEEIADSAGVSPRTFFNYFSCKEEAVVGVDPEVVEELAAEVEHRPAHEGPLEALVAVLVADTDEPAETSRRWRTRTELMRRHPELLPRHLAGLVQVERALAGAVARRLGVDPVHDPYPVLVVTTAVTVLRSTLEWWHDGDQQTPLGDTLREAFAALGTGLSHHPTS